MAFVSKKALDRRTFLKSAGGAVFALPFLDAMQPALTAAPKAKPKLIAIEVVHGSAGSTIYGEKNHLWSPVGTGSDFDLKGSILEPLTDWRDYLTIISNTDVRNAEAFTLPEIGGDHFRSSAVFLTQCHPKQTQGSDVHVGTSLDQLFAQQYGQETPVPSMQLCLENIDQAGGCSYGYTCTYTDSISWASPTEALPMIRDPRMAFEMLFGAGATPEDRRERMAERKSLLDWILKETTKLRQSLGAEDRRRMDQYMSHVREIERRIERTEARNTSGEERELPGAPAGVPDSWDEHIKLMFDLQVLAFMSDTTRVFALKTGRDASSKVFPESGVRGGFHPLSHHNERVEPLLEFARINRYHVSLLPYLMHALQEAKTATGTLLDETAIIYGSPMGNANLHNHKRCPLLFLGKGNGALTGNRHLFFPAGTPMANPMLSLMQGLGLRMQSFGDSTGPVSLT